MFLCWTTFLFAFTCFKLGGLQLETGRPTANSEHASKCRTLSFSEFWFQRTFDKFRRKSGFTCHCIYVILLGIYLRLLLFIMLDHFFIGHILEVKGNNAYIYTSSNLVVVQRKKHNRMPKLLVLVQNLVHPNFSKFAFLKSK